MKRKFSIKLKELEPKDVTKKYQNWMNDYNVSKYYYLCFLIKLLVFGQYKNLNPSYHQIHTNFDGF